MTRPSPTTPYTAAQVEQVARALCDAYSGLGAWELLHVAPMQSSYTIQRWRDAARVALDLIVDMRERCVAEYKRGGQVNLVLPQFEQRARLLPIVRPGTEG